MTRVLLVHDEPVDGGYGAESYVRRLAAGLRASGDDVAVFAGEVHHSGASRVLDVWDPWARRSLARCGAAFRPDVVHLHGVTRELSASVVCAVPGVPHVMTVHDLRLLGAREHRALSPRGSGEWLGAAVARAVARRRLAATVAVSDRVAEALRAARFPAVSTVPVPVEEPVKPPLPVADCHDVAVVARLAPDKGVDLAVDAFGMLAAEFPGSRLLVAGDGPQRDALVARAAPLGDRVRFLGRLGEAAVSELLGGVRAVLVPSVPSRRPEGSSLTAVEAAVHGRPVVASDDPAVAEVTGRLGGALAVPAGDAAALAAALRRLLGDDGLASRLGATGRAGAVARHSVAAVAEQTRGVYRSVLAGSR